MRKRRKNPDEYEMAVSNLRYTEIKRFVYWYSSIISNFLLFQKKQDWQKLYRYLYLIINNTIVTEVRMSLNVINIYPSRVFLKAETKDSSTIDSVSNSMNYI